MSAFHPGVVVIDIGRDSPVFRVLMKSWLGRAALPGPHRGAEPLLHLAAVDDSLTVNGTYFNRLKPENPAGEQAGDPEFARQLWERSARLTGLTLP